MVTLKSLWLERKELKTLNFVIDFGLLVFINLNLLYFTVVKEPPFAVKESGYAGFMFPIEIYLKNKDEPKKIQFSYDFTLLQSGLLRDRYIFQNPNEEFRKKLFKGGGIPVTNESYYSNPDQESRSRDSFTEEKQQLISKPKLSSDNMKKHKSKEHKDEVPHRTSCFENLFGPPIQKPPKVSPEPKKIEKIAPSIKIDKKDKEKSNSEKKLKHEHKESKPEKVKSKEDKDKGRSEKNKYVNKEQEKSKDKPNKRPNERPSTPDVNKKQRIVSPIRRPPSPPRSSSATSIKEDYKLKHNSEIIEAKKTKVEEKVTDLKVDKELKEKRKKEKKSHSRDKERKEKKEHKKESHKLKELPKEPPKEIIKEMPKIREVPKEREPSKDSPTVKEKPIKPEKSINKFSMENLRKTPPVETEDRPENHKHKDKSDPKKHKHKKKDKKRDESKEKHKESSKEKKNKHDKVRDIPPEKNEVMERRETPIPKERSIPEPASPISVDTASQCSSKSGLAKTLHMSNETVNSSHSDSEGSIIDVKDIKIKIENPSPEPIKQETLSEAEPDIDPDPEIEPEPIAEPPPAHKEKSKKYKDKSAKREEKRRKRKAAEEERDNLENLEHRKVAKTSAETGPPFNEMEISESSASSSSSETKVQDNGVSSSLGEDAEPGDLSPDYMVQLRDLQQRIMKIKNNEDLERVVNLIAETGRYEVTTQTFDFDLCLLDRSTVQQLIQLVGC